MSRKITIYSTKTKATQEITTPVTTWGELKPLVNSEMGVASAKCMVRETRNTLENNEAVLPTGDFIVFVYPEKVKSGNQKIEGDAYASLSDAKLRQACNRKSLVSNGKAHVLRSKLRAYDKRHGFVGMDKQHLKVKGGSRSTTIKTSSVTTGAIRGAGSPTTAKRILQEIESYDVPKPTNEMKPVAHVEFDGDYGKRVAEQPNYEQEADALQNNINSTADALVPNVEVNIRDVVKVMRNKFLNMFDELLTDIDSGDIKRDVDVLNAEASTLAKEMGFNLQVD